MSGSTSLPSVPDRISRQRVRLRVLAAVIFCVALHSVESRAQQAAAVAVGTLPAELRPITQSTEYVGRVEAIEHVDIRARVTGFLQQVLFKEGDVVKEGDILYRIEPDTFQAAVVRARGALLEAQADIRQCIGTTRAYGGAGKDKHRGTGNA